MGSDTICFLSRNARKLQAGGRNQFAHHLVDSTAEGDHQVALDLHVEPLHEISSFGIDRISVPPDDLFRESTDPLDTLGRKHFGCRSVGDIYRIRITRRHLPVEQFVEAVRRMNLAERAPYVNVIKQVFTLGPIEDVVVNPCDTTCRTEHDALVVELRRDQAPADSPHPQACSPERERPRSRWR